MESQDRSKIRPRGQGFWRVLWGFRARLWGSRLGFWSPFWDCSGSQNQPKIAGEHPNDFCFDFDWLFKAKKDPERRPDWNQISDQNGILTCEQKLPLLSLPSKLISKYCYGYLAIPISHPSSPSKLISKYVFLSIASYSYIPSIFALQTDFQVFLWNTKLFLYPIHLRPPKWFPSIPMEYQAILGKGKERNRKERIGKALEFWIPALLQHD